MLNIEVYEETILQADRTGEAVHQAAKTGSLPVARLVCSARYTTENTGGNLCVIGTTDSAARPELSLAKAVRELQDGVHIVFILNSAEDIQRCVQPFIRPSALLRRPPEQDELRHVLTEVYAELVVRGSGRQKVFLLKSGGTQYRVPVDNISFFEARMKKIAMKTQVQEIEFYSTMTTILDSLPDYFIRCHKGYIVNTRRITTVRGTSMMIELDDGCSIPYSRSYRDVVRNISVKGGTDNA